MPESDSAPSPSGADGLVLLVVEPDPERAAALVRTLQVHLPGSRVVHVPRRSDAWATLADRRVDLVLAAYDLPDGSCVDLLADLAEARRAVPLVVQVGSQQEDHVLAAMRAGASDYLVIDDELDGDARDVRPLVFKLLETMRRHQEKLRQQNPERMRELERLLQAIRARVSTVYHDINNPLAIISGNAQLLVELGRAMELDDTLLQPIRDIEEASGRMTELLKHLVAIRESLREHGVEASPAGNDLPDPSGD